MRRAINKVNGSVMTGDRHMKWKDGLLIGVGMGLVYAAGFVNGVLICQPH